VSEGTITAYMPPSVNECVLEEERGMADNALTAASQLLPIATDADALEAKALLSDIHQFHKLLEDRRKELKEMPLRLGRQIDAHFKPHLEKCEKAMTQVKAQLSVYAAVIAARRAEAEREAEQIATAEDRAVAPITPAVLAAAESAKAVKTREFKEVVVVDPALIPREYLAPDMAKIKPAALAGLPIPGVEVRISRRAVV
jgi:hypothetical protein